MRGRPKWPCSRGTGVCVFVPSRSGPSPTATGIEPREPFTDHVQLLPVHGVAAHSTLLFYAHEPSRFQHLQMARGRRPGMLEARCDFTGGDLAATHVNGQQDLAPRWMRERGDDCIELCELLIGAALRHSAVR